MSCAHFWITIISFLLLLLVQDVDAMLFLNKSSIDEDYIHRRAIDVWPKYDIYKRLRRDQAESMTCKFSDMELVHVIMDRICLLCHELQSHYAPNTRAECRQNCFKNPTFNACIKIFSNSPSESSHSSSLTGASPPFYSNQNVLFRK